MTSGIYMILNIITGKAYVGQSINVEQRLSRHKSRLNKNKHHNDYLQNAWNKYGEDAFEFNILERCPSDSLDDNEVFWINYFRTNTHDKGYNLESGGGANKTISPETRMKLSELSKGNQVWLGRKHSDETKQKISEKLKGRTFSDETLKKFSEINKGKNNPMYGKNYSLAEKIELSKSQNTTGFFRVSKKSKKSCKNGFNFEYSYYKGHKRKSISSVSINKLKQKVLDKGLPWKIIDESLANQIIQNELGVQS